MPFSESTTSLKLLSQISTLMWSCTIWCFLCVEVKCRPNSETWSKSNRCEWEVYWNRTALLSFCVCVGVCVNAMWGRLKCWLFFPYDCFCCTDTCQNTMTILNYFMEYMKDLHISIKKWVKQMECFSE